ncbi:YjbQ family protein, partial [Candidatus Peregrinibacteria bacterium]|nr:YjbQ family protein [Candidatus Peregrinibacteria bacterium]
MKFYTEYLWFNTPKRRDYVLITDQVASAVAKSGVMEGLCLVSAMHITAAVYVNDAEEGLIEDINE